MDKKCIRITNKINQAILLDTFIVGANSSLDLQEHMLNDQIQRRIKSLVDLNRINYEVVTITIPEEKSIITNSQVNIIVDTNEPEEKIGLIDLKNVPVIELPITDKDEDTDKTEEIEPKKRGRKKTKEE